MRHEQGSVSAEFAVTLPVVISVLGLLLGSLSVARDQTWLTSTAGWAARAIAIGGSPDTTLSDVLSDHAEVSGDVTNENGRVCVTLRRANGLSAALGIAATGRSCVRKVL